MSQWLFNMYMDGAVREVNERVLGRGVELVGHEGDVWKVNQLLYADDTVLFRNSRESLQQLLNEFDNESKRRKLKVKGGKSKVMVQGRTERRGRLDLSLNGEILEEFNFFKYLGSVV